MTRKSERCGSIVDSSLEKGARVMGARIKDGAPLQVHAFAAALKAAGGDEKGERQRRKRRHLFPKQMEH